MKSVAKMNRLKEGAQALLGWVVLCSLLNGFLWVKAEYRYYGQSQSDEITRVSDGSQLAAPSSYLLLLMKDEEELVQELAEQKAGIISYMHAELAISLFLIMGFIISFREPFSLEETCVDLEYALSLIRNDRSPSASSIRRGIEEDLAKCRQAIAKQKQDKIDKKKGELLTRIESKLVNARQALRVAEGISGQGAFYPDEVPNVDIAILDCQYIIMEMKANDDLQAEPEIAALKEEVEGIWRSLEKIEPRVRSGRIHEVLADNVPTTVAACE